MKRGFALLSALMIATAIAVSACDDDDDVDDALDHTSTEVSDIIDDTQAEVFTTAPAEPAPPCSDLDALGDALGLYDDLTVDSTIDEVEDAQAAVADAFEAVRDSRRDGTAGFNNMETAYEELAAAVDDVSGDGTVGEAYANIASWARAVGFARGDIAEFACP